MILLVFEVQKYQPLLSRKQGLVLINKKKRI